MKKKVKSTKLKLHIQGLIDVGTITIHSTISLQVPQIYGLTTTRLGWHALKQIDCMK